MQVQFIIFKFHQEIKQVYFQLCKIMDFILPFSWRDNEPTKTM